MADSQGTPKKESGEPAPEQVRPAPLEPVSTPRVVSQESPAPAEPAEVVRFRARPKGASALVQPRHGRPRQALSELSVEPLLEGFFERRATRRQAQEAAAAQADDRGLGELPGSYGDDTALLLPVDPSTLFVLWDPQPATREQALAAVESPRAVLRVYDGEALVRAQEIALESRSLYLHGLPPGRPYRVEAHVIGEQGNSQPLGPPTPPVVLPPAGPSRDTSVRFARVVQEPPQHPAPPPTTTTPTTPPTTTAPAPQAAAEPAPPPPPGAEPVTPLVLEFVPAPQPPLVLEFVPPPQPLPEYVEVTAPRPGASEHRGLWRGPVE